MKKHVRINPFTDKACVEVNGEVTVCPILLIDDQLYYEYENELYEINLFN